jgi:hypothetical protein
MVLGMLVKLKAELLTDRVLFPSLNHHKTMDSFKGMDNLTAAVAEA